MNTPEGIFLNVGFNPNIGVFNKTLGFSIKLCSHWLNYFDILTYNSYPPLQPKMTHSLEQNEVDLALSTPNIIFMYSVHSSLYRLR